MTSIKARSCLLAALLMTLSPGALTAQPEPARQGFGASLALGLGVGTLDCDGCADSSYPAPHVRARAGSYLRDDLHLGVEWHSNGFAIDHDEVSGRFLSGFVQWYPRAGSGFFVDANLGVARWTERPGTDSVTPRVRRLQSGALALGVGQDLRRSDRGAWTLHLRAILAAKNDYRQDGVVIGKADSRMLLLGFGRTWY